MEPKSPENAGQKRADLLSKIRSGKAVTNVINESDFSSYINAAIETGFAVTKIAEQGEEFPQIEGSIKDKERDPYLRINRLSDLGNVLPTVLYIQKS